MCTSDADLHRLVLRALESDPKLADQEIGIAVRAGVLVLSGYLDDDGCGRAIDHLVARVPGLSAVVQTARVRSAGERSRCDTTVARRVASHLAQRLGPLASGLVARVEQGWVTLEGEVDLVQERTAAEEGTRRLLGVRGVSNCLTVRPPETVPRIQTKVDAALSRIAPRMAAFSIADSRPPDASRVGPELSGWREKSRL